MYIYSPLEAATKDPNTRHFKRRLQKVLFYVFVALFLLSVVHFLYWKYRTSYTIECWNGGVFFDCDSRRYPPGNLLDRIDIDCDGIMENERTRDFYKQWIYDTYMVERALQNATDRCSMIRHLFDFPTNPLSKEEEDFPLAYGLVVYKNIAQVLFMLSSVYHPQNLYCIVVDDDATRQFKDIVLNLTACFPNIMVSVVPHIRWGSIEVLTSVVHCVNQTSRADHPWKYYQYLAGVDVPLKTNYEMVQIFKAMNGSLNFEISQHQTGRISRKLKKEPPLPLYKSSLSALISRQAANIVANHPKVLELIKFLNGTNIPDEHLWATVFGNPEVIPFNGSLSAISFLERKKEVRHKEVVIGDEHKVRVNYNTPDRYYFSRYQVWTRKGCGGKMSSSSCVFGVADLKRLMNRPEPIAHKLYIDYQPAAYFCVLKAMKNRALHQQPFNASAYARLPMTEMTQGKQIEELSHKTWFL